MNSYHYPSPIIQKWQQELASGLLPTRQEHLLTRSVKEELQREGLVEVSLVDRRGQEQVRYQRVGK